MPDWNSVVRRMSPLHSPHTSFPPRRRVVHECTALYHNYCSLRSMHRRHSCTYIHDGCSSKWILTKEKTKGSAAKGEREQRKGKRNRETHRQRACQFAHDGQANGSAAEGGKLRHCGTASGRCDMTHRLCSVSVRRWLPPPPCMPFFVCVC